MFENGRRIFNTRMYVRRKPKRVRAELEEGAPPENVKVGMKESTENPACHKIDLAVDCEGAFRILEKQYLSPTKVLYYYNVATVPLAMSKADQEMYPEIYKAFEAAKRDDEKLLLKIEFNAPIEDWSRWGLPRKGGKRHRGAIRMKITLPDFLERLQDGHRFNMTVELKGYVYRDNYRASRQIPLTLTNDPIALKVDQSGETPEELVDMCPGLFGRFELEGKFTVVLKWVGPDETFSTLSWLKTLAEEAPKDVSIVLRDGKVYECHSNLIRACSPLFTAMLDSIGFDSQPKEIAMKDIDANTLEAFLNFVNDHTVVEAFESCDTCFKLFVLSRNYDVIELQKVTKTFLEVKPFDWFQTTTALELASFLRGLSDEEKLYERVKSILKSRKEELQELERFKKLLEEDSQFAELIVRTEGISL